MSIRLKRFSKRVTENDIMEFNYWIKSKSTEHPRLLDEMFNGDAKAYEDYMMEKQREFSEKPLSDGTRTFDMIPKEGDGNLAQLIGNLMMSISATHFFHLCTKSYAAHMALQEYYEEMPDLMDALAEAILADASSIHYTWNIVPGSCPVEYLSTLLTYVGKIQSEILDETLKTLIDPILEQITSTLYKLKNLS